MVEADAIKNRDVVYQQLSHSLPSSANIAAEVRSLRIQHGGCRCSRSSSGVCYHQHHAAVARPHRRLRQGAVCCALQQLQVERKDKSFAGLHGQTPANAPPSDCVGNLE